MQRATKTRADREQHSRRHLQAQQQDAQAQPRWDDLFQAMLNLEATAANEMRILTEIYIYLQCIRGQMPRLRRSCRCRSVADG